MTERAEYATMKNLQWYAAKLIIDIRENCKISQTSIDQVINGITSLVDVYLSIILEECQKKTDPVSHMLSIDDVNTICMEEYPSTTLFSILQSKSTLDKFLIEEMRMVQATEVKISSKWQWKQKKRLSTISRDLCEVTHCAYIVPFLENLTNLLMNDEVRLHIDNPLDHDPSVYRTVLDGSYYRENEFFRNNKNSLAISLYYDDVGITNPSGASSKNQKLAMFYWTLLNIKPELRSSNNTVQLYAIVKTIYLKEPNALEKILRPFIDDIEILRTEGLNMYVNGVRKNYKGSLLNILGDTPASALMAGFKESVAAYRPCRLCMVTKDVLKLNPFENEQLLRNKDLHMQYLNDINEPGITKAAKKYWQLSYGINGVSPVVNIPYFDVTQCLPIDCMHILLEGIVEQNIRLFLKYCIVQNELFTINNFNIKLSTFNYGHFNRDKPAEIQLKDLDDVLRQSAAQTFVLAHTLPFLILQLVDNDGEDLNDRIDCFSLLLQVMNLCLAYQISRDSVDLLSRMIDIFITRFNGLYPNSIIPKTHFLTHVPRCIRLFGPPRQHWCFRFESAHAYFKSLVPVVRNFKNMPLTMIYRHQSRICSRLFSNPGQSSKLFLHESKIIVPGLNHYFTHYKYASLLYPLIPHELQETCSIMVSPKVAIYGAIFKKGSIILLSCNEDLPLEFGEILDICVYDSKIFFVILKLETICYNRNLNSYQVLKPIATVQQILLGADDLLFPHPLLRVNLDNKTFVLLINHERCEFF
ncbi:uncharacterized protein [Chelonus insularis]|nr:uncharacterized protein LOC118067046 [Chelonus insularis]